MKTSPRPFIQAGGTSVKFGISDFGEELPAEVAQWVGHLEYRISSPSDVGQLPGEPWCIAHAPDPQDEGWLDCIHALAAHPAVRLVNTHARPDDEVTLCWSCGRRMINLQEVDQTCDWCGEALGEHQVADGLRANDFATLVERLRDASDVLKLAGKRLVVENTYEPPDLMFRILAALPADVGFTLDIGHALINWASPLDYISRLRARIAHLHLHDNMGGNTEHHHDKHLPPGAGIAPWAEIARALRRVRFNGTATFECMPSNAWLARWQDALASDA